jgi:hypothetical protein
MWVDIRGPWEPRMELQNLIARDKVIGKTKVATERANLPRGLGLANPSCVPTSELDGQHSGISLQYSNLISFFFV